MPGNSTSTSPRREHGSARPLRRRQLSVARDTLLTRPRRRSRRRLARAAPPQRERAPARRGARVAADWLPAVT